MSLEGNSDVGPNTSRNFQSRIRMSSAHSQQSLLHSTKAEPQTADTINTDFFRRFRRPSGPPAIKGVMTISLALRCALLMISLISMTDLSP